MAWTWVVTGMARLARDASDSASASQLHIVIDQKQMTNDLHPVVFQLAQGLGHGGFLVEGDDARVHQPANAVFRIVQQGSQFAGSAGVEQGQELGCSLGLKASKKVDADTDIHHLEDSHHLAIRQVEEHRLDKSGGKFLENPGAYLCGLAPDQLRRIGGGEHFHAPCRIRRILPQKCLAQAGQDFRLMTAVCAHGTLRVSAGPTL